VKTDKIADRILATILGLTMLATSAICYSQGDFGGWPDPLRANTLRSRTATVDLKIESTAPNSAIQLRPGNGAGTPTTSETVTTTGSSLGASGQVYDASCTNCKVIVPTNQASANGLLFGSASSAAGIWGAGSPNGSAINIGDQVGASGATSVAVNVGGSTRGQGLSSSTGWDMPHGFSTTGSGVLSTVPMGMSFHGVAAGASTTVTSGGWNTPNIGAGIASFNCVWSGEVVGTGATTCTTALWDSTASATVGSCNYTCNGAVPGAVCSFTGAAVVANHLLQVRTTAPAASTSESGQLSCTGTY